MIFAGLFFLVSSFYVLLGSGIGPLFSAYRELGPFPFAFMFFYGVAGGFTALFHLTHLLRGWPKQHLAGIYAIAIALAAAGIAVLVMKFVAL
jgi:hypothetical protein